MSLKLEQKLKSSLISNKLEQEVLEKLDWYRNQLMITTRELNTLKQQISDDGWRTNPDRMGGCYDEDEIRNAYEWK